MKRNGIFPKQKKGVESNSRQLPKKLQKKKNYSIFYLAVFD